MGVRLIIVGLGLLIAFASPGVSAEESSTLPFAERRLICARIRKRRNTARYFKALMQSLRNEEPPPAVPKLGYLPAEKRIELAALHVAEFTVGHLHLMLDEVIGSRNLGWSFVRGLEI